MSNLCFEAMAYIDDRYAYGSRVDTNMLCKIDMVSGECEYVAIFPSEDTCGKRLYIKAVKYRNSIIFSPSMAKNICIYDYISGEFTLIDVSGYKDKNARESVKYADIVLHENYAYVIPATYKEVIKIDMEKKMVVDKYCICSDNEYNFRKDGITVGTKFYLASAISNVVLELDMMQDKVKIHNIGQHNNGSWGICGYGEILWIIPYFSGSIIKWNPNTGEISENLDCYKVFTNEKYMFMRAIAIGHKIYAIPYCSKNLLVIDMKTEKMEWKDINIGTGILTNIYLGSNNTEAYFLGSAQISGWIDEIPKRCFRWAFETNEVKEYTYSLNIDIKKYLDACYEKQSGILMENEVMLKGFIEYIKEKN